MEQDQVTFCAHTKLFALKTVDFDWVIDIGELNACTRLYC